jgi:predicted nucleic acid-binding protein
LPSSTRRIVVTDANVLINLIHVKALSLLGSLDGYEFLLVEEVVAEITVPEQAEALAEAIANSWVRCVRLEDVEALTLFAQLSAVMGKGEAASLALAITKSLDIGCDEKKVFRREAVSRLGEHRILTTPGIFVLAIRAGVITIEQADQAKAILATKRFEMSFASFKDVV